MKRLALTAIVAAALTLTTAAAHAAVTMPTGAGWVQYRPHVITVSADGSWYFGGHTGNQFEPRRRSLRDLGRIRWTQYSATSAYGTAVIWGLYGPGPFSADTQFQNEGKISLHAYSPVNGVFTRLGYSGRETIRTTNGRTFHYRVHGTSDAQHVNGVWLW